LQTGGTGWDFSGDFGTKGCYTYTSGKYEGRAYYGTGGTAADRKKILESPKARVAGHDQCGGIDQSMTATSTTETPSSDVSTPTTNKAATAAEAHSPSSSSECQSSQPYSLEACKVAAERLGLQTGGTGWDFSGDFGTKGCYTYTSGKYEGRAYYGTGGTAADRKKILESPKARVAGHDQCGGIDQSMTATSSATSETMAWAVDGCTKESDAKPIDFEPQLLLKSEKADVRCCSSSGSGAPCESQKVGCPMGKTFYDAKSACEAKGMRLCTRAQVASNICCGTGCEFDSKLIWTFDSEPGTVSPSSTSSTAATAPSPSPAPAPEPAPKGATSSAPAPTPALVEQKVVNVDFKIDGLVFAKLTDETTAALKSQLADMIAAKVGVDKKYIVIALSAGSVAVNAQIKADEAGVDTSTISSKAGAITSAEIVDEVKKVPKIVAATDEGTLDNIAVASPPASSSSSSAGIDAGTATAPAPADSISCNVGIKSTTSGCPAGLSDENSVEESKCPLGTTKCLTIHYNQEASGCKMLSASGFCSFEGSDCASYEKSYNTEAGSFSCSECAGNNCNTVEPEAADLVEDTTEVSTTSATKSGMILAHLCMVLASACF